MPPGSINDFKTYLLQREIKPPKNVLQIFPRAPPRWHRSHMCSQTSLLVEATASYPPCFSSSFPVTFCPGHCLWSYLRKTEYCQRCIALQENTGGHSQSSVSRCFQSVSVLVSGVVVVPCWDHGLYLISVPQCCNLHTQRELLAL